MNPICEVGVVYTPSLSQRLLFTLAIASAMTVRTIIYKIINKLWSKLIEFSEPSKNSGRLDIIRLKHQILQKNVKIHQLQQKVLL